MLIRFQQVNHSKLGTVQLVRLRNPWGSTMEWIGAWGDKSEEWNSVSPAEKKKLEMVVADDGEFWFVSFTLVVMHRKKNERCLEISDKDESTRK